MTYTLKWFRLNLGVKNNGRRKGAFIMEQELLAKLLQTTEETNRTINIMTGAIITMQQDISGLKEDVAELKQDVAELKQDVAELKQDVAEIKAEQLAMKEEMVAMENRIMKKMDAEIADAAKDHRILFNNLSTVMGVLNLKMNIEL